MTKSIAIDGPAGAGKSTIAKLLAKKCNYTYVDTGAMFRAMAIYMIDHEVNPEVEEDLNRAVEGIYVGISYENQMQHVFLNSVDVTDRLRKEEVGRMASKIAGNKAVRKKLLDLQREIAAKQDVIMDGRDIGTVVLPNASLKIYLTASVEARAKRRFDELVEKKENPNLEEIARDIKERDHRDMTRSEAPLKKAEDAVLVDSSNMTVEEVVAHIAGMI
ncbi:MAG: (d)CMP kinase [Lachnospiraceae bacterium]|nr:(d)CMP kinase [Lachnospiraceae bacterium]